MTMMNTLRTAALSLGLACVGSGAFAATVANLAFDGDATVLVGAQSILSADGTYSASIDETFDATEVSDFLFEADFSIDGVSILNEELLIENTTGNDLLIGAFFLLQTVDPDDLVILGNIIAEASDSDGFQTNIFDDFFLSLDLTENNSTASSSEGTFDFLLTEGPLNVEGLNEVIARASFEGSFSISTIEVSAVPLPASLPMLAFGAFGLFAVKRRRRAS